jgi:hypothetical protein
MSEPLKIGDVCEFIARPVGEFTTRYSGTLCTVFELDVATGIFGSMHACEMFDGVHCQVASMFLRKVPPKPDGKPRTDFTPSDPAEWASTHWYPPKTTEPA